MPPESISILLVEDSPTDAHLIKVLLERGLMEHVEIRVADTVASAVEALSESAFDLALTDLQLPDSDGLTTFDSIHDAAPMMPIVILSGMDNTETAMEAVRAGAEDFIRKNDMNADVVGRAVRFGIERTKRRRAEAALAATEAQIQAAEQIQGQLFPRETPEFPGYDIAGAYRPSHRVCGDCYDFVQRPSGELALIVSDVSGHGFGAGLLMVQTRACMHILLELGFGLADALAAANRSLVRDGTGQFVVMTAVELTSEPRTLRYVGAGQLGYLLDGNGWHTLSPQHTILGFDVDVTLEVSEQRPLQSGDLIFLPTDGVNEACNPKRKLLGIDPVLDHIARNRDMSAADLVDSVLQLVKKFQVGQPQTDDITMVIAKCV
ncbi:MAG: SpoIIE family protein phosphatase [Planctomycetota bacterium]|nr:SpoIIE family protein phosphatase [Planctomycetota bacterium]